MTTAIKQEVDRIAGEVDTQATLIAEIETELTGTEATKPKSLEANTAALERVKVAAQNAGSGSVTPADYVTGRADQPGASQVWHTTRWASGYTQCTTAYADTATPGTAWGGVYYDGDIKGGDTLPYTFSSVEEYSIEIINATGSFFPTVIGGDITSGSVTAAPSCYVCAPTKHNVAKDITVVLKVAGYTTE